MEFWAEKIPAGMLLRSPRIASTISDSNHTFALESFEKATGIAPQKPLPLSTFVDYGHGRWFQRQSVSDLDQREVASIERSDKGFRAVLADGTPVRSQRVVVAAGIGPFQRIPAVF
jgi:FAD-dependent urate hydroxylase